MLATFLKITYQIVTICHDKMNLQKGYGTVMIQATITYLLGVKWLHFLFFQHMRTESRVREK